jgi:predicted ATPase/class 3 adenylate cyclase
MESKDTTVQTGSLPSGIVVFLFSDIEGSTRRWESHAAAMRDALRRHDKVVRSAIEARRGYVFKTIGDAFCAAFWTIEEALEAAIDVQRRLGSEDFDGVGGLRVRMAVHAGETDERSGDYYGSAVNRTARLLGAGHGGQILLTGVAADLAVTALPPGISLRRLGTLPLRDIKEPERVFQPMGEGLRSEFAPLRALETPPNNLPRQRTSFVGRRDDVARIDALLDDGALVTIVGAGGIGKTRLALEVAAARLADEPDGVWLADLAAVGNASLIAGTLLTVLGAQPSPGVEPLDDLLAYLERRDLLLLLDNSEHLVAEVAEVATRILERSQHVSILATSRQPLDVSEERVYRLDSLDAAAAVALFSDRARAVDRTFSLEKHAAEVEEICERLDGIALAIELAAARIRTLSIGDLAQHLELRLLAGGRDRRPRQQTMRALIDWSYDLLAADERRALSRCAVFSRGFTLAAASVVCDERDTARGFVLALLGSLVDKSLVVAESPDGERRYRLLEPIREYAWEKLTESGEAPETRHRHAVAFGAFAGSAYDEWEKGPAADWLSRMERDLPNIRSALQWSVGEGRDLELGARLVADATPLFLRLSLLAEGANWCERVLTSGVELSRDVEARLRYGLSMLFSNLGANKQVLEQALRATSLYREASDARGLTRALSQVSARYAPLGRYGDAREAAEEALRIARGLGDRRLLADILRRCAAAFAGDGPAEVRARYQESVEIFRTLGRDDDTARALTWWGQWEARSGNFREAAQRMLAAIELDRRNLVTMFLESDVAGCFLAIGDAASAEAHAREALALASKAHHRVLVGISISHLAAIAAASDLARAARLIGFAEEALRAADWQRAEYEQQIVDELRAAIERVISPDDVALLLAEGAAWSEAQAVSAALSS